MEWPFNKTNYALFGIGIISIVSGYLIVAFNAVDSVASTKIGPVILFIAYCVIIPAAILYSPKK